MSKSSAKTNLAGLPPTPGKLLVVDDFADIRLLLETAFRAAGHDVVSAADVQGAKEELEDEDFDVVITDLDLPDSNGIELTGWIRERGSDTEVIVITGHASMDTSVTHFDLERSIISPNPSTTLRWWFAALNVH